MQARGATASAPIPVGSAGATAPSTMRMLLVVVDATPLLRDYFDSCLEMCIVGPLKAFATQCDADHVTPQFVLLRCSRGGVIETSSITNSVQELIHWMRGLSLSLHTAGAPPCCTQFDVCSALYAAFLVASSEHATHPNLLIVSNSEPMFEWSGAPTASPHVRDGQSLNSLEDLVKLLREHSYGVSIVTPRQVASYVLLWSMLGGNQKPSLEDSASLDQIRPLTLWSGALRPSRVESATQNTTAVAVPQPPISIDAGDARSHPSQVYPTPPAPHPSAHQFHKIWAGRLSIPQFRLPDLQVVACTQNPSKILEGCPAVLTPTFERREMPRLMAVFRILPAPSDDAQNTMVFEKFCQNFVTITRKFNGTNKPFVGIATVQTAAIVFWADNERRVVGTVTRLPPSHPVQPGATAARGGPPPGQQPQGAW